MAPLRIAAAIDVGSNSAHLLVADVRGAAGSELGAGGAADDGLAPLADESVFLGLGERVSGTGLLGHGVRGSAAEAIAGLAARARGLGAAADAILLLGTEPVRRAADGARFAAAVEAAAGIPLHVLTHEEEAWLNILGVTGGRRLDAPLVVIDGGGGSTEVALVRPDGGHRAIGLRLGTASLTAAHVRSDPPTPAAFDGMLAAARAAIGELGLSGARVVMVGGTASNLCKAIPAAREDRRLTRARLDALRDELLATPAAELATRYLLNPRRAPLMASGLAIVAALLERLGTDELVASEASLREGALVALRRAGAGWRDALPRLVGGWRAGA